MSESDGFDEHMTAAGRELAAMIRMLLMSAAQAGERKARDREYAAREAQARDQTAARQMQAHIAAERATALSELRAVQRDDWWEQATPQQISDMYQLAHSWGQGEHAATAAQLAEQKIADEVRTRHGIEVTDLPQPTPPQNAKRDRRFTVSVFDKEQDFDRPISKERALEMIAASRPHRDPNSDIRGWAGIDADVDAALHAKWPEYEFRTKGGYGEKLPWVGTPVPSAGKTAEPAPSAVKTAAEPVPSNTDQPVTKHEPQRRPQKSVPTEELDQLRAAYQGKKPWEKLPDGRYVHELLSEQSTLLGLEGHALANFVDERAITNFYERQWLKDNGIEPEHSFHTEEWQLEQALHRIEITQQRRGTREDRQLTLPERETFEPRAPYSDELLRAAASEAQQAEMDPQTYLDHLEPAHVEQIQRLIHTPAKPQHDRLRRLSAFRTIFARASAEQGRPIGADRAPESERTQAQTLDVTAAALDASQAADKARDATTAHAADVAATVTIPRGRANPDRGMSPRTASTPEEAEHRRRTWATIEARWTAAAEQSEPTGDQMSNVQQRWRELPFVDKRALFWKEYETVESRTVPSEHTGRYQAYLAERAPKTGSGKAPSAAYDSRERRERQAQQRLEAGVDPELVAVAMSADMAFATPAQEAVKSHPAAQTTRARKGTETGPDLNREYERGR